MNAPTFTSPGNSLGFNSSVILPEEGSYYSSSSQEFDKNVRNVIAGATADGLTFVGKMPQSKPGTYLIAYYQAPAAKGCDNDGCTTDFHFVRQDQDGGWSHKPGSETVRRVDSSGHVITDPAKADMRLDKGRKYQFIGYFQVPAGGLNPADALSPNAELKRPKAFKPYAGGAVGGGENLYAEFTDTKGRHMYVRRTQDGKWTRGGGGTRDFAGHEITDPRKANFTSPLVHYTFTGFYTGPNGDAVPAPAPAAPAKRAALSDVPAFYPSAMKPPAQTAFLSAHA